VLPIFLPRLQSAVLPKTSHLAKSFEYQSPSIPTHSLWLLLRTKGSLHPAKVICFYA